MTKRHITESEIAQARSVDIIQFLENKGYSFDDKGRTSVCSSPFSSDSTPSFVVYTDQNSFCDFSTGKAGDIIKLASLLLDISFQETVLLLNGDELPMWDDKEYETKVKKKKPFNIDNYTTGYRHEIQAIDAYARSRGITQNYRHGFYATNTGTDISPMWFRNPSMMFPHTDIDGNITGAKFRNIQPAFQFNRFSARGRLGYYTCDNLYHTDFDTYIVEGEANANSLCEYFIRKEMNARAISFGGVGQVPNEVHDHRNLYIIIDHDGDEKLYQERLKAYEHLNGTPIKLELPKGQDINSLWAEGNLELLDKLL